MGVVAVVVSAAGGAVIVPVRGGASGGLEQFALMLISASRLRSFSARENG